MDGNSGALPSMPRAPTEVNFYKRFVADIQVKTGHLTPAEFGVYDRLLDHYYATEAPLPESFDRCCTIARAMTKADRQATARVLAEFFTLEANGYAQRRADEMIAEAQPKIEAARTNGKRGGRPKQNPKRTEQEPTGLSEETKDEPKAKASQSQNKKRGDTPLEPPAWSAPDWVPAKEWGDFEAMRKVMRGVPFTNAARDGVVRELSKFKARGHDPAALLAHAVTNGHRTVYEPRLGSFMGNKQEAIEASNKAVGDRWLAEQERMDATH